MYNSEDRQKMHILGIVTKKYSKKRVKPTEKMA